MIYKEQCKVLREMAEMSDCVFVGRCADHILRDKDPFRIFVYADMESKKKRCRQNKDEFANLDDKSLEQQIVEIDKHRAKYYAFHTDQKWGALQNYDLCINTGIFDMKNIAEALVQMLK